MNNELEDVWELETEEESRAIQDLESIIRVALLTKGWARDYLTRLWEGDWGATKAKLETEGSVWYVWWMDGVRKHLAQSRKRVGEAT